MAHPYPSSDPTDDDPSAWRPSAPATLADRVDHLRAHLSASPLRSLGLVAVLVLAAGVAWWLLRPPPPPIESALPLATGAAPSADGAEAVAQTVSTTTGEPVELVVQSAGAVSSPGVYRLAPGARVDDLVTASGGLVADADVDRVNLAAPVGDGERVWFPLQGDEEPPVVVAGGGGGPGPGPGATPGPDAPPAMVNLNTATAAELDTLPGVGPSTASAILAHREEHGPFAAVDDLLEVRGIGDAKLEQIRPLATV
ncbi:MAG: helix-hairpin-helix domain-containing protein [Aquihabitans sp.]